ncbi:MAG: HAMP domain-containing histidine kinase [Alphaproteobacteria bacterium]|nr:HAMP domain-containing histidine kinase [Alphaproteobacteria bacterium]
MEFFYSAEDILKSTVEKIDLLSIAPLWGNIPSFVESISGCNFLSSLVFMVVGMSSWLFALSLTHSYKIRITTLKATLLELKSRESLLIKSLLKQEQDYKNHQISCQAYKKFLVSLMARQKNQAQYIYRSLDVVKESLKNPIIKVSGKEREEIMQSCLEVAQSLTHGSVVAIKKELINLKKLLEKIRLIFLEKIYQSNIELEFICPEDVSFYADSFFAEFILTTLVGKSIYCLSKNEKMTLIVKNQGGALQFEIQDKGYTLIKKEKLIKKAFAFFMTDETFHTICQENGLIHHCSKVANGLNITIVVIPDAPANNVVKLFKGQSFLKLIND